ncbi:MAG: mechanosensitive ion channel family protein [Firmicutes bacterium]|nr:mechanosensitive ion channel family protein [Bacillota bacterium]
MFLFVQFDWSGRTAEILTELALVWGGRLLKTVLLLLAARIVLGLGNALIKRIFSPAGGTNLLPAEKKKTVQALSLSIWRYVVYFFAALLVLSNLGVAVGPILAGAGIVGLAVGFGAQNLVKDVIAGFFLLLEDQFAVGDFVVLGGYAGIVEDMGLRTTRIRDASGELHIIPNGMIDVVTNRSRGSMQAVVDVSIAYEEDLEKALALLSEVSAAYAREDQDVLEGPAVLGVVDLSAEGAVVRLTARTVPMAQGKVERNLRRAIRKSFAAAGIEIPYPRRVCISPDRKGEDRHG